MNRITGVNEALGQGFKIKSTVRTLADMDAFNKAHKMAMQIYSIAKSIPLGERYALASKLKRASSSISVCLADNLDVSETRAIKQRRARHTIQLVGEIKSWLLLASQSGFINNSTYLQLLKGYQEISKTLSASYQYVEGTLFDQKLD